MKQTLYIDKNIKKWKLDPEESEEYRMIETTEAQELPKKEKERLMQLLHEGAKESLRMKRMNVNFRLQVDVLDALKVKAARKGLPYQTLISLILHEYAKGKMSIAV